MPLSTKLTDITTRWTQNATLATERLSLDFVGLPALDTGGGAFQPPTIDPGAPDDAIWQRLIVRNAVASARSWAINNGPRYAEGIIKVDTFFPRYLSAPSAALVYAEEAATTFHRQNFGVVRCRDANGPEFIEIDRWPNFKPIEVTIPFYIYEVN